MLKVEGVIDVAVIAIENDTTGEAPAALIVAKEGITTESIIADLKPYLENYAIPKTITFATAIPRAETGKVMNAEVETLIRKQAC